MDNYTTKLEIREDKKEIVLPQVPFVVTHRSSENVYIAVKKDASDDGYLIVALSNGVAYDLNYTKDIIEDYIKDGTWILRESKIILK